MTDPIDLRVVAEGRKHPGLDLPESIGEAEWREIGSSLAREQRADDIEWRVGDWAARADGDLATLAEAAAIVGESPGNLRKYVATAKAYPNVRRRTGLAFYMHLETAALPEADREALLDCAEAEHWTRAEMREAVRDSSQAGENARLRRENAELKRTIGQLRADARDVADHGRSRLDAERRVIRDFPAPPHGRRRRARRGRRARRLARQRAARARPRYPPPREQAGRRYGRRDRRARHGGRHHRRRADMSAHGEPARRCRRLGDSSIPRAPGATPVQGPGNADATPDLRDVEAARVSHDAWQRATEAQRAQAARRLDAVRHAEELAAIGIPRGDADRTAAAAAGVAAAAVGTWRRKVKGLPKGGRIGALLDAPRAGRPAKIEGALREDLEALACHFGDHLTAPHAHRTLVARHGAAPAGFDHQALDCTLSAGQRARLERRHQSPTATARTASRRAATRPPISSG